MSGILKYDQSKGGGAEAKVIQKECKYESSNMNGQW